MPLASSPLLPGLTGKLFLHLSGPHDKFVYYPHFKGLLKIHFNYVSLTYDISLALSPYYSSQTYSQPFPFHLQILEGNSWHNRIWGDGIFSVQLERKLHLSSWSVLFPWPSSSPRGFCLIYFLI